MKVLIFTEGGRKIGLGHLSRCIALYEAFAERGVVPEIIANADAETKSLLKGKKHIAINWVKEKEKLSTIIKNADIVIVDSYITNIDFYNSISDKVKICVFIDDNKRIDYPRGVVINPTIYAERLNYPNKRNVKYLLGSKFMILRKEFRDVPKKKINEDIKSVMITFGGSDINNLCPIVLNLLVDKYPNLIKNVIVGKGYDNVDEINRTTDKKTHLIFYPDAEKIKEVMSNVDLAISAGGQTLNELARIGVPTVAILTADNQMNNINGWLKAGFIEYAGCWDDNNLIKNITDKILILQNSIKRKKRSLIGKRLVDGIGVERIVSLLEQKLSNI